MDTTTMLFPRSPPTTPPSPAPRCSWARHHLTAPTHGMITQTATAMLTYRPMNDYRGTDTFTYTVTDTHGAIMSNPATVTLSVISPLIAARRHLHRADGHQHHLDPARPPPTTPPTPAPP